MEILDKVLKKSKFHGLEIGTLRGDFVCYFLEKYKECRITSIDKDPFKLDSHIDVEYRTEKYKDRYILIIEDSLTAWEKIIGVKYDFVFIDGDHSYSMTMADIKNYKNNVIKGGILCGHNYDKDVNPNNAHPGVKRAVDEVFGNRVTINSDDAFWWVKL